MDDKNGNMVSSSDGSATTDYSYDYEDKLAQAGDKTYERDAMGRVASSTDGGGEETDYDYDGSQVIREVTASGQDVADYTRGLAGRLISRQQGNSSSYYHHDAVGSVVGLSDSAGALTDTYSYDAFGDELGRTGTSDQPYRYLGNRQDASTGLSDFYARSYQPSVGRFTSKDPIRGKAKRAQTMNPYAHGANGPLAHPDPSGLFGFGFLGGIIGEIGFGGQPGGGDSDGAYFAEQASAGLGIFFNNNDPLQGDYGGFASYGDAEGYNQYDTGLSYNTGIPSGSSQYYVNGGALGASGGIFFSPNANSLEDIRGPFRVDNVTLGPVSGQGAHGYNANGDPVDVYSVSPIGVGGGGSVSRYQTDTGTLQTGEFNLDPTESSDTTTTDGTSTGGGGDSYQYGG